MAQRAEKLPYGVGRTSTTWYVVAGFALALLGFGVYAYFRQLSGGEILTGLRTLGTARGATWGLYIALDAYFVGLAFAGLGLAALIRLFDIETLRPMTRVAQWLAVTGLVLGGLSVLADLGQPARGVVNLFKYARPGSPFFGTLTLVVAGSLIAALTYLYLDGRRDASLLAQIRSRLQRFHHAWAAGYGDSPAERERHRRSSFWLAVTILPLLIAAQTTLGLVYGLQVGRPGWYSAIQAPGFVLLAAISGVGLIIVLAAFLRRAYGERERLNGGLFRWLGIALAALLLAYFYILLLEMITGAYQDRQAESRITSALLTGEYAWLFWLVIGLLVVAFTLVASQLALRRPTVMLLVVSGVLVNLASIGKRYLTVVPSQTHGSLLPYEVGSYSPTWIEYGVVLGLVALGVLLFAGFMKIFPLVSLPERKEGVET